MQSYWISRSTLTNGTPFPVFHDMTSARTGVLYLYWVNTNRQLHYQKLKPIVNVSDCLNCIPLRYWTVSPAGPVRGSVILKAGESPSGSYTPCDITGSIPDKKFRRLYLRDRWVVADWIIVDLCVDVQTVISCSPFGGGRVVTIG